MSLSYDFNDQLRMSRGVSQGASIKSILLDNIPSAVNAMEAHEANDRNGTDWWVECCTGKFLSVDCKVRSEDWAKKGKDDLALESWSVVEQKKVGWTRDGKKQTDYVLWLFQDTGRWVLIPFPMLCAVFREKWQAWERQYFSPKQHTRGMNGGYHSQCIFVPRREVWREIYLRYGGNPDASHA